MKKSSRISLLVFTIVFLIAISVLIWFTRPSLDSDFIEEARKRQDTPLLEVDEPLRFREKKAETVVVADGEPVKNVDVDAIVDEVYGRIDIEGIKNSVQDSINIEAIKDSIANDDSFIMTVADKLYDRYSRDFTSLVDLKTKEIMKYVDSVIAMTPVGMNETEVKNLIDAYLPQIVDSYIPSVVTLVDSSIDRAEAEAESKIQAEPKSVEYEPITDEMVLSYYDKYRDSLIYDVSTSIMADLESRAYEAWDYVKSEMSRIAEETVPEPVTVFIPEPKVQEIIEPSAVPAVTEPIAESEPVVTPEPEPEPVVEPEPIPEPVAEPEPEKLPVISLPSFEHDFEASFGIEPEDPVDYASKREEIRNKTISDIINSLH